VTPSTHHEHDASAEAFAAFEVGDWERARALFASLLEGDEATSGDMLAAFATCCGKLGAITDSCRTFERAFAAFVSEGNARRAARVAAELVLLYEVMGEEAACRGWEQRGLRVITDVERCVERGYLALARTGCEIHDAVDLERRADLALELAREFGDHDLELRARAEKGLALVGRGYINAGFALLDEATVALAAGEMRDADMRDRTFCSMLSACERTGDVGRADYWCKRIEDEAALHNVLIRRHCRVTHGLVDALRGEWDKAEAHLTYAMRGEDTTRYHRGVAAAKLAEVRIQQGRYDDAEGLLSGYEDRFEAIPARARLRMVQGHYGQAAALLRSAIRGLGEDATRLAPALSLSIEVELLRDDVGGAKRALEQLRSVEARCESDEIRAYVKLGTGRVARYVGDLSHAIDDLEAAIRLLVPHDRPLLTAQVRFELARALVCVPDAPAAVVEAEAALTTFRRLGVVPDAAAAEQLLERLTTEDAGAGSVRRGPRTPTPLESLTPRENEVASLVADGLTNREIAERLVLSVRTVEGHVDRILGKLHLHTRTQLAKRVGDQSRGAGT
jgi:DNA-binding CsgD family transcriptional regulator